MDLRVVPPLREGRGQDVIGEGASTGTTRGALSVERRQRASQGVRRISVFLLAITVGVCPLLAGSVHRPALIAILSATSLTFVFGFFGERLRGRTFRGRQFSLFFLLLVLLPVLQLVPMPSSWRGAVDPGGFELLKNAPHGAPRFWPLSLDPASTREEIGTAAAALVVFMLALHNAVSRRRRMLVLNAVAAAGLLAVVSGLAHRIFGIDRLYGLFPVFGAALPGPFINPNHAAEFYELTAFVSLALAQEADAEARIAWYVAAGFSAAAALATLSRGSLLALAAGGAAFLFLRSRSAGDSAEPTSDGAASFMSRTFAWSLLAVGCLFAIAFALGASPILGELARTNLTNGTEKIIVWRDSLTLLLRHPWGIGRHAFDRVYPAYKTLPLNTRFEFVENGPLQLLIDLGWPAFGLLIASLLWSIRKLSWRRDDVGSALLAALVAVATHNFVDFGLETAGIRLSFAAVAGVAVGRAYGRRGGDLSGGTSRVSRAVAIMSVLFAPAGLLIGLYAQRETTAENLEARWKEAYTNEARRKIAVDGGSLFPTDFFFPLLQSYDEPLRAGSTGSPSPRLAALNRAMRLCPTCWFVHEQAALALQRLGLRDQALSSYRDTVRLAPSRLWAVLTDVDREGYRPAELATLAVGGGPETLSVAKYLIHKGETAEATVLDLIAQAGEKGVAPEEILLTRADLAATLGHLDEARTAIDQARAQFPRDGRPYAALAHLEEREGHLDVALDEARLASANAPLDVDFARHRLALILQLKKWDELDLALEQLKATLRQSGQSVTEVHMVAGQTHEARGNLTRALSEFRTATMLDAANPGTWGALARASEAQGDLSAALDANRRILTLRPDDIGTRQTIERLEKERNDAQLRRFLP